MLRTTRALKPVKLTNNDGEAMQPNYKVLRLFTSDGRALTCIESADSSILLPHEIHLRPDGLGTVKACHTSYGDEVFASLDSFCWAYRIDRRDIIAALSTT